MRRDAPRPRRRRRRRWRRRRRRSVINRKRDYCDYNRLAPTSMCTR